MTFDLNVVGNTLELNYEEKRIWKDCKIDEFD